MLGMYDMPEIQAANDRYWQAIRDRLGYGPASLSRDLDYWEMWQSPDLLLGQTCGMPYRTRLHDKVTLIGTPDFGLPDCPPGYYQSVIVARSEDTRDTLQDFDGARFAYNENMSQSGWAGPFPERPAVFRNGPNRRASPLATRGGRGARRYCRD